MSGSLVSKIRTKMERSAGGMAQLVVTSTRCSSRGPKFRFQHPHQAFTIIFSSRGSNVGYVHMPTCASARVCMLSNTCPPYTLKSNKN